jgi:hypothetical protein
MVPILLRSRAKLGNSSRAASSQATGSPGRCSAITAPACSSISAFRRSVEVPRTCEPGVPLSIEDYPPIGSTVEAIVLGDADRQWQVHPSLRPSDRAGLPGWRQALTGPCRSPRRTSPTRGRHDRPRPTTTKPDRSGPTSHCRCCVDDKTGDAHTSALTAHPITTVDTPPVTPDIGRLPTGPDNHAAGCLRVRSHLASSGTTAQHCRRTPGRDDLQVVARVVGLLPQSKRVTENRGREQHSSPVEPAVVPATTTPTCCPQGRRSGRPATVREPGSSTSRAPVPARAVTAAL